MEQVLFEQFNSMRAETAELQRLVASLRQDHAQLAGSLESEAQGREAQGRRLETAQTFSAYLIIRIR